ncbi:MAG: hypothetical protein V3U26_05220 [Dehalococcoidia bacterium]
MKVSRIPLVDLVIILGGGPAIIVTWAAAVYAADAPLSVVWLLAILGIYYVTVLPGISYAHRLMSLEVRGPVPVPSLAEERKPEVVSTVTVPALPVPIAVPVTVQVVGARGRCPMGYRPGRAWTIERDGSISSGICQPAAEALGSALKALRGKKQGEEVSCTCPLVDASLRFALQATA